MSNIVIEGILSSQVYFDYGERVIRFLRDGATNASLGRYDVDIPFDDVTGFIVKKPNFFFRGNFSVIVNDTLPATKDGELLTWVCVPSFYTAEAAIQQFCKEVKNVPVYKQGAADVPKANYTKQDNPYKSGFQEFRMRCNVCGKIYCFSKDDINKNIQHEKNANLSNMVSVANAVGGSSYHMYEQSKQAEAEANRIVDYSRCPNCNSTNVTKLTDEEFNKLNSENVQASLSVTSSADELVKYKALLDSGVITQEEFDAKKKQLLGLC